MKKINKFATGVGVLTIIIAPIIIIKLTEDNFDFTNDLSKLKAKLKSTKFKNQLHNSVGSKEVGTAVTPTELGFAASSLSKDVTVSYVVKMSYDTTSGIIVVTATLTKDKETVTKDITITAKSFDFSTDKKQFQNVVSTKVRSYIKLLNKKDEVTSSQLGIVAPKLSKDVKASYTIKTPYNPTTGMIHVRVILTREGDSDTKTFTVTAKSFNFSTDLAEINDATSSKIRAELKIAPVTTIGADVTGEELGIEAPDLSDDVTISYQVQTLYDSATGKVVVLATFRNNGEMVTKNITITAKTNDFAMDLLKFHDFISTKNKTYFETLINIKHKGRHLDPSYLGLGTNNPTLSSDVTIAYQVKTPYDSATGKVILTVILRSNGEEATKDIIITARPVNFSDEFKKINDVTSSKIRVELKMAPITTMGTDVTTEQLGIEAPALLPEFTVTYRVQTPYDSATGKVVVLATLTKDGKIATKAFIVTAKAFDFSTDLAKINDVTSSKFRAQLKIAPVTTSGTNVNTEQLGIEALTLSSGVSVTYQVQTPYVDATGKVVVLATLTKDGETATKAFIVTAFDFSNELTKIKNLISSKTKAKLIAALATTERGVTAEQLGIKTPSLLPGVSVTYQVQTAYVTAIRKVVVLATLTKDGKTATKAFTVTTILFDFSADLAKINDVTSSKFRAQLKTAPVTIVGMGVTAEELGIKALTLSSGVSVSYQVQTPYDSTTGKVVVLATFAKDGETATKAFTVTGFDFSADLAKINDATSSILSSNLKTIISSKAIGDSISTSDLGILDLVFPNGVIAHYVVNSVYVDATGGSSAYIMILVTLTKDGKQSISKNIKITALEITSGQVSVLNTLSSVIKNDHVTSTKTIDELKSSIGTKNAGDVLDMEELGILSSVKNMIGGQVFFSIKKSGSEITNAFSTFIVTIALKNSDGTYSMQQEISITPKAYDFNIELTMLVNLPPTSTKSKEELKTSIGSKRIGDNVSPDDLGIDGAILLAITNVFPTVEAYLVVKTPYNEGTGSIVLAATLKRKGEKVTQERTVTAAT